MSKQPSRLIEKPKAAGTVRNRCHTCVAFSAFDSKLMGHCHALPPALIRQPDGSMGRTFVPVVRDDWCMQWRPRTDNG